MKRPVASLLCAALLVACPGPEPYQAFAQLRAPASAPLPGAQAAPVPLPAAAADLPAPLALPALPGLDAAGLGLPAAPSLSGSGPAARVPAAGPERAALEIRRDAAPAAASLRRPVPEARRRTAPSSSRVSGRPGAGPAAAAQPDALLPSRVLERGARRLLQAFGEKRDGLGAVPLGAESSGRKRSLSRPASLAASALLGLAVLLSPGAALGQDPAPAPGATQESLERLRFQLPREAIQGPARLPLDVELRVPAGERALGDPIPVRLVLRNTGSEELRLPALAPALDEALAPSLAVSRGADRELTIPAGGSVELDLELMVVDVPQGMPQGAEGELRIAPRPLELDEGRLELPAFALKLRSVIPAGQRQPKPKLLDGLFSRRYLDLGILAAWLAGLAAAVGAFVWWRNRRGRAPKPKPSPPAEARPVAELLAELDALEAALEGGLPAREFYRRLGLIVLAYLGPRHGLELPRETDLESTARTLRRTLDQVREKVRPSELEDLALLRDHAEATLYDERELARYLLSGDVDGARRLLGAEPAPSPAAGAALLALPLAGLLAAADPVSFLGVAFDRPLFLLLFIPFAAWLALKLRRRARPEPHLLPSSEWLPARRPLRSRLLWLPPAVRAAALSLGILALADPLWGLKSEDRAVTSLDTVIVLDHSGSMESDGKLDAAKEAARTFIQRQEGTTNRLALVVFDDRPQLVMSLTLDHDALENGFEPVAAAGGTDIGRGLDEAVTHFIEMAILDSDAPGAEGLRTVLKERGLAAAVETARNDPALLHAVIEAGRHRAVIFISDGQGGDPAEAIGRARAFGIRIYAVGIPPGMDEGALRQMAHSTSGRYFRVGEHGGFEEVFLEIERLQSYLVRAHGSPEYEHHGREFAGYAALALLLSLLLTAGPFRLKTLPKGRVVSLFLPLALAGALSLPPAAPAGLLPPRGLLAQASPSTDSPDLDPGQALPYREIPALREGNRLFEQRRYDEAARRYIEVMREHPTLPEGPLNLGITYLRQGRPDAARSLLLRASRLAREQGRPDIAAAAEFELGNHAASEGRRDDALRHYRDALRERAGEDDSAGRLEEVQEKARWNYEWVLRQPRPPRGQGQGRPQRGQGGQGQQGQQPPQGQAGAQQDSDQGPRPEIRTAPQVEQALRELGEQARQREGGSGAERGRGRGVFWSIGPFFALPMLLGQTQVQTFLTWFTELFALPEGTTLLWLQPELLLATAVAVLAAGWLLRRRAKRLHEAARRLDPGGTPPRFRSWEPGRAMIRSGALTLSALLLLGTAASGPVLGSVKERSGFGGQQVLVAQDVSLSVLWSEDGRFDHSVRELEEWLRRTDSERAGDRIGLLPFAGTPGEATLSHDHRNALFALHHLRRDADGLDNGSDLLKAVQKAAQVFEAARGLQTRGRVLIVISDGGHDPRGMDEAAEFARSKGIVIHAVGVGAGSPVPMRVPEPLRQELGDWVRDEDGRVVETALEPAPLRALAEGTGGRYLDAGDGSALAEVLDSIAAAERRQAQDEVEVSRRVEHVFLLPGVALLLLGGLLSARRRRPASPAGTSPGGPKALAGAAPLALLSPFAGVEPALIVFGLVAALLLGGWWLGRAPKADPRAEPARAKERLRRIELASKRIRVEPLLSGEFISIEQARSGAIPDDAVLLTNEGRTHVDHRTSARMGELYAKRFEDEPEIPLLLLVDLSASSAFGTTGASKREVLAETAGALALAASRENMPVGAVFFSDRIERVVRPRHGSSAAREIARLAAELETAGRGTDLALGLREAARRFRRRGLLVVLSDFNAPGYAGALAAAAAQHLVLPVMVEDALEAKEPPDVGLVRVRDAESGTEGVLDTASAGARRAVRDRLEARRAAASDAFKKARLRAVRLTNEEGYLEGLVRQLHNGGK